jgi:hypothetical protein
MSNLFGLLDIEFGDFIEICLPAVLLAGCLEFGISEVLNTRDIISKDYHSVEYSTVKFHTRVHGSKVTTKGYGIPLLIKVRNARQTDWVKRFYNHHETRIN